MSVLVDTSSDTGRFMAMSHFERAALPGVPVEQVHVRARILAHKEALDVALEQHDVDEAITRLNRMLRIYHHDLIKTK